MSHTELPLFDAHFHVVDPRFPLVPNRGYLPERYTVSDYRERMEDYDLRGGAVVSGSFQAFDQYRSEADVWRIREAGFGAEPTPLNSAVNDYVKNYLVPRRHLGD